MIKVLIVEDSPTVRSLLVHILGSDPDLEVIGGAADGEEALEFLKRRKPDVVLMDVYMPRMDGLEATARIMETTPVPVVIASASWDSREVENTFRAIEAGAVALAQKPRGVGHPNHREEALELVRTVKLMSEVKVVRRWGQYHQASKRAATIDSRPIEAPVRPRVVAVGASTGGPPTLRTLLSGLPSDFPVPLLIVHHIAPGFLQGLVDWLGQSTSVRARVALSGEDPLPGHVYFAPEGAHMGLSRDGRIETSHGAPENGLRPAVSYLFRSVAEVMGRAAVGVLLTGMGKDGARELRLMRDRGAITFAQDIESSAVHGMPGEAIRLGGATYVLPPEGIAVMLRGMVR